jgi:hypothetical protein
MREMRSGPAISKKQDRSRLTHVLGSVLRSTPLVARTQTNNRKYGKNQSAVSGAAPARDSPIPITSADHPSHGGSARVERAAEPDAARNAAIAGKLLTMPDAAWESVTVADG